MNKLQVKMPKWTVNYNIVSKGSPWIGTGWEFFNDEWEARKRYDFITHPFVEGFGGACMRPFYKTDIDHLGACHRTELVRLTHDSKEE